MLEPPEKSPTSKDEEESTVRWREGCNQDKIESCTWWVGNPRLENHGSSPTGVRVLGSMSRFLLSLGARQQEWESPESLWGPAGLGCGTSTGPGETFHSWRAHKVSRVHQAQGRWAVTPLKTEPDLPASLLILSMATWKKSCFPKAGPWISC